MSKRAFLTALATLIVGVLIFRLGQTIYYRVWVPEVWIRNLITGLAGGQTFGDVFVANTSIMIMILAIVTMVVLVVNRSRFGKAMRAVAEDKPTAQLMGIDVDRIIMLTFVLESLLAGMAGIMLGLHNRQITHVVDFLPGLKAFTAAVLGGIGNVPGAVLGGFFLGLAESLGPTAFQIPSAYKDVIACGLIVLILVFRPTGLLGERLGAISFKVISL